MFLADLLLFFMLIAALAVVFSPKLIHSLIALGIFSSMLAIQYVLLKAPDVALTEAALGTGLSTLIYLTAIRKTAGKAKPAVHGATKKSTEETEDKIMVHLLDYIQPQSLHPLVVSKREEIIRQVLQSCIGDMEPEFINAVAEDIIYSRRRESPLDMNLGNGFALVHSRQEQCPDFRVTVGLLPRRIRIYKGEKVHTVIGIVLPSSQSRQYLAFLARFGRLINTDGAAKAFEEAGKLMGKGEIEKARKGLMEFIRLFEEG